MKISPDIRLIGAVAAWTAAAAVAAMFPLLVPALIGAGAVVAALVAWDAVLLRRAGGVEIQRQVPPRAFVGREAEIILQLRNSGDRVLELSVVDEVASDLAAREPSFQRVGVPPRGETTLRYLVKPTLRGDRPFGPVVALVRSPLGFLRCRSARGGGESVRVYPDATHFLRPEALNPRRVFAAIGVRPERRRGEGMEFESLRDYVPGDDPRRIDWAATARRGRTVTRLYQHERHHTVVLALDASRLMGGRIAGRTKLDFAVDAALALVYAALVSGDRIAMTVFDQEVHGHLAARSHRRDLGLFVELLRPVQPRPVEANYEALARSLAARQRQRALLVVLSDFVEADSAAMIEPLVVLARRHKVLLVAVRDRAYAALEAESSGEGDPLGVYRRVVLDDLLRERETALAHLRRRGLQTLDLVPEAITASVLNRYLAIRYGPER